MTRCDRLASPCLRWRADQEADADLNGHLTAEDLASGITAIPKHDDMWVFGAACSLESSSKSYVPD